MQHNGEREILGIAFAATGTAFAAAAIMAPLPAGLPAIAFALLGLSHSRRRWVGRTAVAAAATGTLAGFAAAVWIVNTG